MAASITRLAGWRRAVLSSFLAPLGRCSLGKQEIRSGRTPLLCLSTDLCSLRCASERGRSSSMEATSSIATTQRLFQRFRHLTSQGSDFNIGSGGSYISGHIDRISIRAKDSSQRRASSSRELISSGPRLSQSTICSSDWRCRGGTHPGQDFIPELQMGLRRTFTGPGKSAGFTH